jgi:hypothetical protein
MQPIILPALLNFVRPSPHSKFSPSAADRWLSCPFSINATVGIPEEQSVYSIEGTLAHSVCEAVFRMRFFDVQMPEKLLLEMAMLPDHGQEMMDCAHAYADTIIFWLNNESVIGKIIWFGLEKGIPVFPEEGCFGTADCLIIGTKGAVVLDFKYGKGKNVAPNSLQLKVYAAGVFKYLKDIPENYKFIAVVHQPRTDMAPKEHTYAGVELGVFLNEIKFAIDESKQAGLTPLEGNHCFWCPAKRTKDRSKMCPSILEKPLKLAQENFKKFMDDMSAPVDNHVDPNPKRDQAIMKIMGLYPLMKQVYESGMEEFKMRLQAGEAIPGIRLVEEYGNRTLNAETDDEKARLIKEKFNIEAFKQVPATKKLKTITEIEKEIGKNKLDSICVRKVTKKVDIMDEKMRDILGEMAAFGTMIKHGNGQEDT